MAVTKLRFAGEQQVNNVIYRGLGTVKGRLVQTNGTPMIADVVLQSSVWRQRPSQGGEIYDHSSLVKQMEELAASGPEGAQAAAAFFREFNTAPTVFYMLEGMSRLGRSDILGPGGEVLGGFVFNDILPGAVNVTAHSVFTDPSSVTGNLPSPMSLGKSTLDLGDIIMTPKNGEIRGRVFLPDGVTPVGAGVRLILTTAKSGSAEIDAFTAPDGTFHLPLALSGPFQLRADTGAPDVAIFPVNGAAIQTERFFDEAGTKVLNVRLHGQTSGVVPPGKTVMADVRLRDTVAVKVMVVGDDGVTSIPGALVNLVTASPLDSEEQRNRLESQIADDAGTIELFPVIEGDFTVTGSSPGRRSGVTSGKIESNPPHGTVIPVVVRMGAATSSSGEVKEIVADGRVVGTVFTADGPALGNPAEVRVTSRGVSILTTSGSDGRFAASGVPTGPVTIDVYEPATARRGTGRGHLASQGQEIDVPVVLVGLGSVAGTVFNGDGSKPIASALVTLYPSGNFTEPLLSTTDTAGAFLFPGVPIGSYRVAALDLVSRLKGEATGAIIRERDARTTDVLLQASGSITGTLYQAGVLVEGETTSGGTVTGASVEIVGPVTRTVVTGADGRFDSGPYLPIGVYSIRTKAPNLADGAVSQVAVKHEGDHPHVMMALAGLGTVRGVVLDSSGVAPVLGAQVTLNSLSRFRGEPLRRVTAADGRFVFPNVPVGAVTLSVITSTQPRLGASAAGTLARHEDELTFEGPMAIRLQPSGRVVGRVVKAGGAAVEGVVVSLKGGGVELSILSESNGQFAFDALPLGDYGLTFADAGTSGVAARSAQLQSNGQTIDLGDVALDGERPQVVSVAPSIDAADAPVDVPISVTFSEPIAPQSVTPATFLVSVDGKRVPGSLAVSGSTAVFRAAQRFTDRVRVRVELLADERDFEGRVTSPGIRDLAGLSLAATYRFSFTTADATPPLVKPLFPRPGAVEVPGDSIIRVEFNEPISLGPPGAVLLSCNGAAVAGATTLILGDTAVLFEPAGGLKPNWKCEASLGGQVADRSGNVLAQDIRWGFSTTDTEGPTLVEIQREGVAASGATIVLRAVPTQPSDAASIEFSANGAVFATVPALPFVTSFRLDPSHGSPITFRAVALDQFGNRGPPKEVRVDVVADRPPEVAFDGTIGPLVDAGQTVEVRLRGSDDVGIARLTATVNQGAVAAGSQVFAAGAREARWTFPFVVPTTLADGTILTVQAGAVDGRGQGAVLAAMQMTVRDRLSPSVAIGTPVAGVRFERGEMVPVFVKAIDPSGVATLQLDLVGHGPPETVAFEPGGTQAVHTFMVTMPALSAAVPIDIRARAVDRAGNVAETRVRVGLSDRSPPSVNLALAGGGVLVEPGTAFNLIASVTDDVGVSRVRAAVAGGGESERTKSGQTSVTESFSFVVPPSRRLGEAVELVASADDTSGNRSTPTSLSVTTADLSPPAVEIVTGGTTATARQGEVVVAKVQATDRYSLRSVRLSSTGAVGIDEVRSLLVDGEPATTSQEFVVSIPTDAPHGAQVRLRAEVVDASGHKGSRETALTVEDVTGPSVLAITPSDGAADQALQTAVVVDFDEPIAPGTVTSTTLFLNDARGLVPSSHSFETGNRRVVLRPVRTLTTSQIYTVVVTEAILDLAGNRLVVPRSSSFRTVEEDRGAPTVLTVSPSDRAGAVVPAAVINVEMSEAIEPTTAIVKARALGADIKGVTSVSGTTVNFVPAGVWPAGTEVFAEVDSRDLSGNRMAQPFAWRFTVADADTQVTTTIDFDDIPNVTSTTSISNEYRGLGAIVSLNQQPAVVVADGVSGNGAHSKPNSLSFGFQGSRLHVRFVDPITGAPAVTDHVSAMVGDASGDADVITMSA
ncbi:MAG TPA: Ig-like domain-containing protein [Polyangia bacterium]